MKIKLTEAQLKQLIRESLDEVMDEEDIDEGRFSNFFKSVGAGAKEMLGNGGINSFRQGYGNKMGQLSQADADAAEQQAAQFRAQQNAGYKDIPAAQKIAAKYDGKINNLKQQISNLQTQKKSEMQAARKEHMSKMGKQVSKFNKQRDQFAGRAASAVANAQDAQNRRLASLGLEPIQGQQQNIAESKLDRIVKGSIKKVLG